jgi:hypothetical protein
MPAQDPGAYYDVGEMLDIDPDILKRLAEKGLLDEEATMVLAQQARSERMSETPMPEATQVGRTTIAPNPLQYAAAGIKQGVGNYQMMQQQKQLEALRRRKGDIVLGGGGGY